MILIPQRLFKDEQVTTILRDGNVCILQKALTHPVARREGYIANHVVSILLSGEQHIQTYEDELIRVQPHEVLFIPRGMYHITDLLPKQGTFRSLLFYFDDAIIQEFLSTTNVSKVSRASVPDHLKFGVVPTIRTFAESLISIYKNQRFINRNFLGIKMLELLYLLNELVEDQLFANFLFRLVLPKKRTIKTFMESNFDKPLKVEDYAYLTGRSVSTFRRNFKSYYDSTPQKWLKERRMDRALQLFNERDASVTQVAYEVGYENVSYFIKEFKSQVGLSPKQYLLTQHRNNLLS